MATPKRGARLAGGPSQQKAVLRNQATELFRHGRIRTTEAKAKLLRPYAERLITKAKAGDLHKRRQVLSEIRDRDVVAYLFDDVAPRFADRNGGYTRIVKLPPRKGDNARMAIIELVDRGTGESGESQIEESKSRRSRGLFGRRRRNQESDDSGLLGGLAGTVTDSIEDATEAVTDTVEDAADTVAEKAEEIAEDTDSDVVETVAETVEDAAETVEDAVADSDDDDDSSDD